jgi:ubiquitin-like 1-activating enzyme E1 B
VDNTEDAENSEEIENLRKEAQALMRIREKMGSEDFPRLVFEKVYKEDIERLRSMEEMWKTRRAPEPLDYDQLSKDAEGIEAGIAKKDQVIWTPAENFAVFKDSLKRLSDRLEESRAKQEQGSMAPILTFDKDDEDTLDFVAASANLRSHIFGIETHSKFQIKRKYSWVGA